MIELERVSFAPRGRVLEDATILAGALRPQGYICSCGSLADDSAKTGCFATPEEVDVTLQG